MPRIEPTGIDLKWCESHVILKAILPDSTVLRLGSAQLSHIPEEDENLYSYEAKITKDAQIKITTTGEANQAGIEAENVDKELGLTLNNVSSTLIGAKIICSKVFAPVQNSRNPSEVDGLAIWYAADKVSALPNATISTWNDLSENSRDTTVNGSAPSFILNQINGLPIIRFTTGKAMNIPGSFALAQVFIVFKSADNTFPTWSLLGASPAPFTFSTGTTAMTSPFPTAVRKDGSTLASPFDLTSITNKMILNVKTNDPTNVRSYIINKLGSTTANVDIAEIIGFTTALPSEEEQYVEAYLSEKYGFALPYVPFKTWDRKVLLVGEISGVNVTDNTASISIVSDIAPNVAFISARPIQTHCPLIFKGTACGYSGPLTTCNKLYDSEDGCAGRANQHRFGGIVTKGELPSIIPGGIDTIIGDGSGDRFRPYRYYGGREIPLLELGVN